MPGAGAYRGGSAPPSNTHPSGAGLLIFSPPPTGFAAPRMHHPVSAGNGLLSFLSLFPARRKPGAWDGSSKGRDAGRTPRGIQVQPLSVPPALVVSRRDYLLASGRNDAACLHRPPGFANRCPFYMGLSGHGVNPLPRATEFAAPRAHHGAQAPDLLKSISDTPERRGARRERIPAHKKGGSLMDIRKIEPRRERCYLCGAALPKGRCKYCLKCRPYRPLGKRTRAEAAPTDKRGTG